MKNKGLHQHRFDSNPLERKFANAWESMNNIHNEKGVINYLLAKDNSRPNFEITDREREVAATIIQWLGSPVGNHFVREIIEQE